MAAAFSICPIASSRNYERVATLNAAMAALKSAKDANRKTHRAINMGALYARLSAETGIPVKTLDRKYRDWVAAKTPEAKMLALADGRKELAGNGRKNPWLNVYLKYCERDANTNKGAWRAMMRDFRAGVLSVPGVGNWQEAWRAEHKYEDIETLRNPRTGNIEYPYGEWEPYGATYANLEMQKQRYDANYRFNIAFNRQGRKAAHKYLLPVLQTRVGLPVGAISQFDDVWLNDDIIVGSDVSRPVAFVAYDYASAYQCVCSMKPRTKKDSGGWKNLNEYEFRCAFAHFCMEVGFRKDGHRSVHEHGTTRLPQEVEDKILAAAAVYGFNLEICKSGILSEQAHAGLFKGNGGGNFRFKALCEGAHNIVHNALAFLPGSRGRDAEHLHESEPALVKYEQCLLDAAAKLDPIMAAKIIHGLETFEEYAASYNVVVDEVMRRTDHRLEGWGANMVREIKVCGQWKNIDSFVADSSQHEVALAGIAAQRDPSLVRTRAMSRWEVWDAGVRKAKAESQWAQFPAIELPRFFTASPRAGRPFGDFAMVQVRDNGLVRLRDSFYFGRDEILFRAVVRDSRGYQTALTPGSKHLFIVNPVSPEYGVFVSPEDGRTLGVARRYDRAPAYDRHAIEIAMGAQAHDLAQKVLPMRGRHQEEAENRAARLAHNAAVLAQAKEVGRAVRGEPLSSSETSAFLSEVSSSGSADAQMTGEDSPEDPALSFLDKVSE